MAYHHFVLGGVAINLSVAPLEIEGLLKWGNRLLYLELFLFLIMSMFYWDYPPTIFYAGAILSFFYVARIWNNYSVVKKREVAETICDMYSKFVSGE